MPPVGVKLTEALTRKRPLLASLFLAELRSRGMVAQRRISQPVERSWHEMALRRRCREDVVMAPHGAPAGPVAQRR